MKKRRTVNPKRRMISENDALDMREKLADWANSATYDGNPEHKRNPGDFGLKPPSLPRKGKTLCDGAGIFKRAEALRLLQTGMRRGLVSEQQRNGWPQNVWAVTEDGIPLEAALGNQSSGIYHGYPLLLDDSFCELVLIRWKNTSE